MDANCGLQKRRIRGSLLPFVQGIECYIMWFALSALAANWVIEWDNCTQCVGKQTACTVGINYALRFTYPEINNEKATF
jgi:hypothetical protein